MRDMNIQFQAYCPDCKKTVAALQKNEAAVEVGHSTKRKVRIGDHRWILANPRDRDYLRKRIAERLLGRRIAPDSTGKDA